MPDEEIQFSNFSFQLYFLIKFFSENFTFVIHTLFLNAQDFISLHRADYL